MRTALRRIGRDIRHLRNIDAYVVSALALVFAVLSVIGDLVSEQARWAAVLAGLGLLVYRITLPAPVESTPESLLGDRGALDALDINARLRTARTVWLYAPSAVNFLLPERCELMRTGALARPDGSIRVVVLDPDAGAALDLAARQLDDSVDFLVQHLRPSLEATLDRLRAMEGWDVRGSFEHRLLDYNPGFSLLIIDPESKNCVVVAEIHGYHGESTASRMHVRLTRPAGERWITHWISQFEHIWSAAHPPPAP
ncbi:hypothetical protein AB0C21_04150 [Spirillospora sp. NPDC049024]